MARRRNGVRIYANSGQSLVDGSNVPETLDHAAPRQSASPPTDSAASSQIPAFSTSSRTSTEQIYVFLRGGIIEPSEDCSRVIRGIFEERQDFEGFTWKNVSKETKMFYFLEFEAVILGRKPFPREVYVKTHTKKGDGMTFINEKSKKVNDTIEANRLQLIQNNEEIDENKLYFDSVGGLSRKKVVYGLGSVACEYFRINTASFVTHELEGQQIIRDLKRRLDEQDKLIEELQRQNEIQQRKNVEDMQRQIDERIRAMIGAP